MTASLLAMIFALAYWRLCADDGHSLTRSAIKSASVALLAAAGWIAGAPAAIIAGLALGSAGDFWLSRPGKTAFLAGMGFFAAGHLAYAGWFWSISDGMSLIPTLAMLALVASTELWLIPKTGDLRWPVRAYVLIIAAMAIAAAGLPPHRWAAQIGAALFVLSDLLLAVHLFRAPRRWLALALWPAYWMGQALILAGSL